MVGNDMDFLAALYSHGAQGHFDAVGVHTDTACLTNGPDAYYRDERGRIGRYTFTGYREVHAVMSAHGDGAKPIWMTELGWNTQSTRPRSCNTGTWAGKKRIGVSEQRQARFLRAAYRCLAADPFVGVALWFGLQDIRGSAHARGYGLFRSSGKRQAVREGVQAASPWDPATAAMRRGRRPDAADAARRSSPPRPPLRGQAVGTGPCVRRRGRHGAGADPPVPQRAPRPQLGRHRRRDRPVVGVGRLAARPAHAHVPRPRQRAQRDLGLRHG